MKIILLIVLVFVMIGLIGIGSACSCIIPGTPLEERDSSSLVFSGKVTKIESVGDMQKEITFRISETFKGEIASEIKLKTAKDSAACGYEFENNRDYLVYTYGEMNDLSVNICSRTALLSDAGNDVKELKNSTLSECKNLYWIDDDNKNCERKEFCGMYMYQGLQTFASREQCEKATNTSNIESCRIEAFLICCEGDNCIAGDYACPSGSIVSFEGCDNKCNVVASCTKNLSNGRKAEIKIMPETASERAIQRLGELNFSVELKEVGNDKVAYELESEKEGKVFGLFRAKGKVSALVNAETGEVEKVNKPWWAFLASGI